MHLVVATEARFFEASDGTICSSDAVNRYAFWTRYLDVFASVSVFARVFPSDEPTRHAVEGEGVSVHRLPPHASMRQFLCNYPALRREAREVCRPGTAILSRLPGPVGGILAAEARRRDQPYGVEVVGDPMDVFAPNVVNHPLRGLLRRWFVASLRRDCRQAACVAYVSTARLPRRYPSRPEAATLAYSSIDIEDAAFVSRPRPTKRLHQPVRIVTVGSLSQLYKGIDVLIDALALLTERGLQIELTVVGDGRFRPQLEKQANQLKLSDRVHFLGQLSPGDAVREQLDRADLFVLPSRTEGLPRATIEAMARGLPVIGSDIGGFIELLADADRVPVDHPEVLAAVIEEVARSPERLQSMSGRNLETASRYRRRALSQRRQTFLQALRSVTLRHTSR